jgi:uncharacterized protein YbjQ (UPF0145 family)
MAVMQHKKVSGVSGNEIYCLHKLGMSPGQLCLGNSVVALGVGRGVGAGLSTLGGGEVEEVTRLVHDGRMKAFDRAMKEAAQYGGAGLTGVSFDMVRHGGNLEFITTGTTVHTANETPGVKRRQFSTSADAQEFFCQVDAGFTPLHFAFGNVAYSIGVGRSITGGFRQLLRGEVPQYSQIFDHTRRLALSRIVGDAMRFNANAVVGIETTISPLLGAQEMMMIGTASHHPLLSEFRGNPVTSDMTSQEMWNMVHIGYMPIRLVMGVSVYSLGLAGGIFAALQSVAGGEVTGLTEILYEAREKALARIEEDAEECGADEVVGVKTRVYDLGNGLVEFMAIGTAVKKMEGAQTSSPALPPQAIIQDRDTLVDSTQGLNLNARSAASATKVQGGPLAAIGAVFFAIFYIAMLILGHK